VRGQFIMWRYLLTQSGGRKHDLLVQETDRMPLLRFEALEPVEMPIAVPEDAWRVHDPNAANMVDADWLL
jgi:hypothetical protein